MRQFQLTVFLIFSFQMMSQTGIGTTTPHASAKLEVNAADKGFLPPRVTLTSSSDNSTIPNPATGLLVYNTGTNAGLRAGYYYWNGTDWTTIATASSPDQMVDYIQASLSANQTLSAAGNVNFNTSSGAGITITSGGFQLQANKTYKLEAALGGSSTGYGYYTWVDNTNAILPGSSIGVIMKAGAAFTDAPQDKAVVYYTPTVNTTVYLRIINISGSIIAYAPSTVSGYSSTWASIQQVGSSAFVNPWVLSGNDVYNTTGKVGIGTTAPAYSLEVNGTAKLVTAPGITTATSVLVRNPTTSQISEQPISYITGVAKFIRNTNQGTINAGTTVLFNTSSNNTISNYVALNTSTGVITLQPGTYELNGSVGALGASAGSNGDCRIYPVFHNGSAYVGTGGVSETGPAGNWNGMPQNNANYIITVPVGQTAQLTLKAAIVNNVATLSETGDFGAIGDAGRAWVVVRKYN